MIFSSGPFYAPSAQGAPSGTTYYVSPTGSDSANGLSPTTAWQTIAKVNAYVFNGGDSVLFQGGQTFSGALSMGTANWGTSPVPSAATPVTFGSYGTGRATISSGTSSGFTSLNLGGFVVRDLMLVGGGQTTTTVDGVLISTTQAGNAKLDFVQLLNLDVSLYGQNGIFIIGSGPATAGFNNLTISGCVTHDCTGGTLAGNCGIKVGAPHGYGQGATTPSHTNVLITGCVAYNNTGKAGHTDWTGSGILVGQTSGGAIQFCEAYNNGANSTFSDAGPVGIWFSDSINSTIQFCESYSNKNGAAVDGDGFDLDGGTVNCVTQYCYSHDNFGPGFNLFSYNDGSVTGARNNTIRYCISQNDGAQSGNGDPCGIFVGSASGATLTGVAVHNNTVYASVGSSACVEIGGAALASTTGHVSNNIFYLDGGSQLINFDTAGNPSGLHFDGNDYFAPAAFSLRWNTTTYTSLASWKTATSQETVNGGLTSDPMLAAPGGGGTTHGYNPSLLPAYKLLARSPMIGVGINMLTQFSINPVAQDYYGTAIPIGVGTGFNVGASDTTAVPTFLV